MFVLMQTDAICVASCPNEVEPWSRPRIVDERGEAPPLDGLNILVVTRLRPFHLSGFRHRDLIKVLWRVCSEGGYPPVIRVDLAGKFILRDRHL